MLGKPNAIYLSLPPVKGGVRDAMRLAEFFFVG